MTRRDTGPRLGRGLAALIGDVSFGADLAPAPSALAPAPAPTGSRQIPVEFLEPSPFQPRGPIDPASLTELVESVKARGILQPLLARPHPDQPGRFQIIAGERRWRAAQAAGLHEVPALVRDLDDVDAMAAALVENLQRQDLNAIEEAEGYRRLLNDYGMTQESLATAVGKSRSHVANTLRLLNLPASVQAGVRDGALTAGHARALLALPDPEKAAQQVIARGLNVRQTEALANQAADGADPSRTRTRSKDPETQALENELSERLGLKVEISFDGKGGMVRIHYRSLDQLDGVIAQLNRG
ncbi:Chromosome-partitioning protein ParB [Rhodovastum atsumiense]|uniref:ParB/RepB/Spo0J family partition protein n=1 Tax=Rhodovastum atsumiense TaxID=504468 RepID=A0A5M6IQ32_9PROT|nr:ParB/RepB/Spo0J family partition protein [Rhodovastum atsumiense]KAA5610361.1 ParB/RepB/Spo0J family partition protein [Rhodovastum atsumiense]CAH2600893.1 Chromosome-partitioning protein ParB [Rhodovastum atsumiense]